MVAARRTTHHPVVSDHTLTAADGTVLVALDMYEHAYHMDFGAKAAAYVDAFMGALDWANADRIFKAPI
jgi:Fe-Mn family superoxide dismutase